MENADNLLIIKSGEDVIFSIIADNNLQAFVNNTLTIDETTVYINYPLPNTKVINSTNFDVLSTLSGVLVELLEKKREISDLSFVGNMAYFYEQSTCQFLLNIDNGNTGGLPKETSFGIYLGNNVLTFAYSSNELYYIELAQCYPDFYTDNFSESKFNDWMSSRISSMLIEVSELEIKVWQNQIEQFLPSS